MSSNQASFGLFQPFAGTIRVRDSDPLFAQLTEGKIIRLAYRGKWLDAFRIERVDVETQDSGLTKTASGRGALAFLEDAIVWYDANNPGTEREFTDTYAGILLTLLSEAQARSVFGLPIVATFTADTDSAGNPIGGGMVTLRLQVGSTLLDYVRSMWERGIWIRGRWNFEQGQIELDWIEPPYGKDLTESVRFRLQQARQHRREKDATYLTTALLVKSGDAFLEVRDDAAITSWGRRERMLTLDNAGSNAEAQALAQEVLSNDSEPHQAITLNVEDLDDGPRVFIDYDLGDIIAVYMPDTEQWENWRVVGFTLDFQDHGRASVHLELNREPADYDLAQARMVQRATMGRQNDVAYQGDPAERQKAHEADPLAHRNLQLGDTGGDVTGTVTSATVAGLQGNPVSNTVPQGGQVLTWNAATGQWEPADPADSGGTPVGGDLSGTVNNATVVGLQGKPVGTVMPAIGDVLTWDGAQWGPGAPSGGGGGGDADTVDGYHAADLLSRANHTGTQAPSTISPQGAGSGLDADTVDGKHAGDFASASHTHVEADITDLNHDAVALQGRAVAATAPSNGDVLTWDGTQWGPAAPSGGGGGGSSIGLWQDVSSAVFYVGSTAITLTSDSFVRYTQIGNTVIMAARIKNASGAPSGEFSLSIPSSLYPKYGYVYIGSGKWWDQGTNFYDMSVFFHEPTSRIKFRLYNTWQTLSATMNASEADQVNFVAVWEV